MPAVSLWATPDDMDLKLNMKGDFVTSHGLVIKPGYNTISAKDLQTLQSDAFVEVLEAQGLIEWHEPAKVKAAPEAAPKSLRGLKDADALTFVAASSDRDQLKAWMLSTASKAVKAACEARGVVLIEEAETRGDAK